MSRWIRERGSTSAQRTDFVICYGLCNRPVPWRGRHCAATPRVHRGCTIPGASGSNKCILNCGPARPRSLVRVHPGPPVYISDLTSIELLRSCRSPLALVLNAGVLASWELAGDPGQPTIIRSSHHLFRNTHGKTLTAKCLPGCPLQRVQSSYKIRIQAGSGFGEQITRLRAIPLPA